MRDLTAPRVLELVNRVDRAATREVVGWLERVGPIEGRPPRMLADLTELVGQLPTATVEDAHLMWRGTALELFEQHAERGCDERSLMERAQIGLAERCDAALAAVAAESEATVG